MLPAVIGSNTTPSLTAAISVIGHCGVAGAEIYQILLELLDSRPAAECLVIDLNFGMQLVIFGKPLLVERRGKGCAGPLQGDRALGADRGAGARPHVKTATQGYERRCDQRYRNKR